VKPLFAVRPAIVEVDASAIEDLRRRIRAARTRAEDVRGAFRPLRT
jgi:hypothetical protein